MTAIDPQVVDALRAALTADQLVSGISKALDNSNPIGVLHYLAALAYVDPRRAALIKSAIDVAAAMKEGEPA